MVFSLYFLKYMQRLNMQRCKKLAKMQRAGYNILCSAPSPPLPTNNIQILFC